MAMNRLESKYLSRDNDFYRRYYPQFFYAMMIIIALVNIGVYVTYYEVTHRPPPIFTAVTPKGERMVLNAYNEPNLLPATILRWAKKAATTAYTFNYVNYKEQLTAARPFFTDDGWASYLSSVNSTIDRIVQNQLFVNSVVTGTPVISRQGALPGVSMAWRVEIPFLVVYQSANTSTQSNYIVLLTIVPVPTAINPAGIGISQFVMA